MGAEERGLRRVVGEQPAVDLLGRPAVAGGMLLSLEVAAKSCGDFVHPGQPPG